MRTVGVEEELLLVSDNEGTAVPFGEEVVGEATSRLPEQQVEHELMQEQVEIASAPCDEMAKLTEELLARRAEAAESAAALGAKIAAIATNPGKLRPHATPDERYLRMVEEFGLLGREQLTCGQHIHVSVDSRAEGVAVLDRIRGWLPVLTALSSNSPFWQEQDTGYASFRTVLWGRWPSAGPSDLFGTESGYEAAVRSQLDAGSALDDGMIYFDARLSANYPTVEIRVADVCTDVRDAVLLAALARGLVETAARESSAGLEPLSISTSVIRSASWRAARWGITGTLVDPTSGQQRPAWQVVQSLVAHLEPALADSGDLDLVRQACTRIAESGTGAQRQRAVYARDRDLDAVVADAARRTLSD
jgi:carboxylate-amine ligase